MTVHLHADELSIEYPLLKRFSLSRILHTAPPGGVTGDRFQALTDISFTLSAGDRIGIIGPNGAGKTTLLKALYGILPPTRGSVTSQGRIDALFNVNLGFRKLATGRRNIVLRGLLADRSMDDIRAKMDSIIEFADLAEHIDQPFGTYSQGMAARLAFATATAFEPGILLMDEWIGAGDRDFQQKARIRMKSLVERAGIVVIASHNEGILKSTCNKGLYLRGGNLEFFGDIADAMKAMRADSNH